LCDRYSARLILQHLWGLGVLLSFKGAVRARQIRRWAGQGPTPVAVMLDPLLLYILISCMTLVALAVAAGDFS
jgi:hypothetical protein